MIYGYARVSTREQKENRQLIALKEYGIEEQNIFIDKQSGKDFNRYNYQNLLKKLTEGDVLVINSINILGRNYKDVIKQWQHITQELNANIVVLDMKILDTTQHKDLIGILISDIVLQLLSYVAESECINIKQSQANGIAAAKTRGVRFGRPQTFFADDYVEFFNKYCRREISRE